MNLKRIKKEIWLFYLKGKKLISILISICICITGCLKKEQPVTSIPMIDFIISTYNCKDGNYMKYKSGNNVVTININTKKVVTIKAYANEKEMLKLLDIKPGTSTVLGLIPDIKITTIPYKYESNLFISSRYIAKLLEEGYIIKEYIFTPEYIDMILSFKDEIMRIIITKNYIRKYDNISKINMAIELYIYEEQDKERIK